MWINKYIKKNIEKRALEDVKDSLEDKTRIYEIDKDYFINYDDIEEKNYNIELINT